MYIIKQRCSRNTHQISFWGHLNFHVFRIGIERPFVQSDEIGSQRFHVHLNNKMTGKSIYKDWSHAILFNSASPSSSALKIN